MNDPKRDSPPQGAPWWRAFFDDLYADVCLDKISEEVTESTVSFLIETLALEPGSLLLDQCCGTGRLSTALALRGQRVLGIDINPRYISRAQKAAVRRGVECQFLCADALTFTAPEPCDAVINWFTSFGYHPDDEADRCMFRHAFDSLKPGGRLACDYFGLPRALVDIRRDSTTNPGRQLFRALARIGVAKAVRTLRRDNLDRYPHEDQGGLLSITHAHPDFEKGVLEGRWSLTERGRETVVRQSHLRMYMPHEIMTLLRSCGFIGIRAYGSTLGEPLTLESRRCILVALKPA
jgi:SAM-dependent methyltransferase